LLGVTALLLSCLDPTLLSGNLKAAYAPPPNARKSASDAATFA
jgi:hypothetical protein